VDHGSRRFEARAPGPREQWWRGRQSEVLEDGDDDVALLDVGDALLPMSQHLTVLLLAATAARTSQNVVEVEVADAAPPT
jgi:hypothetical protein